MNIYINWAAPTVDRLFVCGLPSEPSSLDLYHALTPIFLGCSNACMPVPIQSNHIQIYQHEYTAIISNHTIMSCN